MVFNGLQCFACQVAVLRQELDRRDIASTGKKKELVEKLLDAVAEEFENGREDASNQGATLGLENISDSCLADVGEQQNQECYWQRFLYCVVSTDS